MFPDLLIPPAFPWKYFSWHKSVTGLCHWFTHRNRQALQKQHAQDEIIQERKTSEYKKKKKKPLRQRRGEVCQINHLSNCQPPGGSRASLLLKVLKMNVKLPQHKLVRCWGVDFQAAAQSQSICDDNTTAKTHPETCMQSPAHQINVHAYSQGGTHNICTYPSVSV